MPLWWQFIACE